MKLYDVMRTTFAVREFTDDPLPDPVLYRILDNARFAPSGGNRQGTHVVAVRDPALRERLAELNVPGARRYFAQAAADESPWNPIAPSNVPAATIADTAVPDEFTAPFRRAAIVLVITVDLTCVAAMDQHLDRIGVVSGASVYPLVWNICWPPETRGTAALSPRWPSPKWRRSATSSASPTPMRSPPSFRSESPPVK